MLYTIKKSDLDKNNIKGVPLIRVLKANPRVPLKTGAVVNLPPQNAMGTTGTTPVFGASLAGYPSGVQGTTGVSNTGQGIPNIVVTKERTGQPVGQNIGQSAGGLRQTQPYAQVRPTTFMVPYAGGTKEVSNTITIPALFGTVFNPPPPGSVGFKDSRMPSPASGASGGGYLTPQPAIGGGYLTPQPAIGGGTKPVANRRAGAAAPIGVRQSVPEKRPSFEGAYRGGTQTKPPSSIPGYPQPPNNDALFVPGLADEWKTSVDSGFAQATAAKWERMKNQFTTLGSLFEMFTPQELDWFRKFGKPMDIQYFNSMFVVPKGSKQPGMNNPSAGGGGARTGATRGRESGYSSSAGAFYGLVNWRL